MGEPVVVSDLGITVGRHEVWITRSDLEASDCLRALIRLGKVRVSSGARCRVSKDPPKRRLPTSVLRTRPNGRGAPSQQRVPPAPGTSGISAEEAQEMADRAADRAAKSAVESLLPALRDLLSSQQTPSVGAELDTRIEQAVSRALGNVTLASGAATSPAPTVTSEGPDEPLFIPSGIVKGSSESLSVKSESTQSGGLNDAASALKAIRKGTGGKK